MGIEKRNNLPTRSATIKLADGSNPLFRLKFNDVAKGSGETPNNYQNIAIDANGSDDSKLIIFINIGSSSALFTQYQFSAAAAAVVDPDGNATTITHTQVTTLKALIKAIQALGVEANRHTSTEGIGLWIHRLHAPADYSLDTDDFIDLTQVSMSPKFTDYLYKDASEVLTMAYRLGVPGDINGKIGRGMFEFISAQAYVDSNSATDCTFKMSYDPDEVDESEEEELGYTRLVPDATHTSLWDFHENPPVLNGPVLIELTSTSSMAENAQCIINYRSAEE